MLCLIADNVPRGKVSEGRADIDSVAVYVDGQVYEDAVQVTGQDDGQPAFWRQHPYKGTFAPISVNIPLEEGTHIIRVETSANAAGNTGFDEVAVTLEKRAIPIDLEGADPPPPPTPVTETRGLWDFARLVPPPPFAPAPIPFDPDWSTSLVFHLDTPGYAPDSSGHGYDGTFYGTAATVSGGRFYHAVPGTAQRGNRLVPQRLCLRMSFRPRRTLAGARADEDDPCRPVFAPEEGVGSVEAKL